MKKFLIIAVVLAASLSSASAQLGVRLYHYRPTGTAGSIFKPTFSAEVGYTRAFEENWVRPSFYLTVMSFKPRMQELPVYGTIEDYNGTTVYPGTQTFHTFVMLQAQIGLEVAVFKREKFNAYIGSNLTAGGAFIHYEIIIPRFKEEEGYVSGSEVGLRFRLGAEYQLTESIGINLSANRGYFLLFSEDVGGHFWSNDYGLGMVYTF